MSHTLRKRVIARMLVFALTLLVVASSVLSLGRVALAANPAPLQTYYISLPEDDILRLFDDNDAAGGGNDPVSPVRSVTYVSIGTDGTLVYYDQWEDGSYDADIANPGSNVYNASANPDGTQIWGDGVLGNGCPPNVSNTPNPCLAPADDVFENGDVIVLDNNVVVNGATPGPYTRNPAQIFFDGRDKFASSLPVAVARALWPSAPGSVMAGGTEVLDTNRWGTQYVAPIGENTPAPNTSAFEDVRWMIMAGVGGATINVDANNDGDFLDVNDLNGVTLAEGQKRMVDGIQEGAYLNVTSGNPVQVNQMTADVDDTFEFRWDSLIPRSDWTNDYYSPVGTQPNANNSGCTEIWAYNPNASAITINYTMAGGGTGTFNVPARDNAASLNILYNSGVRLYTTGSPAPVFLPLSMTDCTKDTSATDGRLYDWGNPMFPSNQLTPEVLVGWAPGCTDESQWGVCLDDDLTGNTTSRSVVWVTPISATNIFVDLDGSGIVCTSSTTATGVEQTINATALTSYRLDHDPTSRTYVHDNFGSVAYNRISDNVGFGLTPSAWASNWTETGDNGAAGSGAIWITGGALQFRDTGGNETGLSIQRSRNLSGQFYSRLSFDVQFAGSFQSDEALAVEVSPDGGSTWYLLEQIAAPISYPATAQLASRVYRISPYNSANTAIRFRALGDLEAGDTWSIDEVHIDNAPDGDFDMTGAYIRTCNETAFAAAYGQDPALSGGNDDEALDLGTGIAPYGARISVDKVASEIYASAGDLITYTYAVRSLLNTTVNNVRVVDDLCEPETYVSGDTDSDTLLEPGETWLYQCTTEVFVDTMNTAYACALLGAGEICSVPDQATVAVRSAVGDFIWVDEDGDGDQDAGESGMPNVRVTLIGTDISGNPVSLVTYTDSEGRYVFADVPPSNASGYTIAVDTTTLPAGLAANPTYDENGVGTPHATTVVLGSEKEHMTADFGYNWTSPSDTNSNTGTGAIGDRVWIDADGNGLQDPGEAGIHNVTVQLFTTGADGLFGTADDVLAASTTTGYSGNYIFDGLSAGAYVVRLPLPPTGYTQTGDPDGTLDNQTTAPIVLAPGDVFLNADFGYQPNTGNGATIGDTIWIDANRNNAQDAGESPLADVSVSLIRDLNGNGAWDAGEPIIATDLTDINGQYQFNGVPVADGTGTDDYLVWVNDTANVLQGLTVTFDSDGNNPASGFTTGLGISAVTDLAGDNLNQDFAYTPSGHIAGEGLIGDTIWLDTNNDGNFDPGEGAEGVLVSLLDTSGNVLTRVRTNENGQYFFGGLAAGTYTIQIDYNTLPGNGLGLTNFVDPDGGSAHQSTLTLAAGEINLAQDFGYRPGTPNSVGGTIWQDTDADGVQDGTETTIFSGVIVGLYEDTNLNGVLDEGDRLIGTTNTDGSGNYNFTNLPDATYFVDVTDEANRLNGDWHSLGAQGETADGQSKTDVYRISLSGGENRSTVDFGYYRDPASISDFVWNDLDRDGIQDAGESGISGAIVRLTITWPNGASTTVTTVTDANGNYRFNNLLLDEDFDGVGAGEPTFTVTFETPTGYLPTLADQGGNDNLDSDGANETVTLTEGQNVTNVDSGFKQVVSIGDRIWSDYDGDGSQDANEPGLAGVVVELNNGTCTVGVNCPTRTTDANGNYSFDDLPLGTYTVVVRAATLPTGMSQTGDPDPTRDNQHTIVASAPGVYNTVDFGYRGTASLGNYVWDDLDNDGVQDAGEPGIDGVTVWVDLDNDGVQDLTEPSAVTDATGAYTIGGLTPGTFTARAIAPSGATPTYDLNGIGTLNQTSVTLNVGENRTDVDWGYRYTGLSIRKLSSVGGTVTPGQTITYTIIVRNNLASQQTGIAITDPLPAGTTYVAQSTVASGYTLATNTYLDQFSAVAYNNSNGSQSWASYAWAETGETTSPSADQILIVGNELRFQGASGTNSIERQANLSSASSAQLTFDCRASTNHESADTVVLSVSGNGTNWTDLGTIALNTINGANCPAGFESFNISSYMTANTRIRFTHTASAADEYFYVDNVQIQYTTSTATTRDNIPAGANLDLVNGTPSNLVVAGDNFLLTAGQSMTVTFRITVNNPVVGGLTSINNTASVTSTQQITPQLDSTIDFLPLANLGDHVWYDANNNGFQDGGERGVSGVTVRLYDPGPDGNGGTGDDVLVATTTTNDTGNYAFNNVVADTYFVQFVQPTGYDFTTQDTGADTADSDANASTGRTGLITLTGGSTNNDLDAGLANSQLDYGDLPSSYNNTILGDNGPRHLIGSLRLGANIGPDPEGQEDPAAALDTFDDGVTRNTGNWTNGATVDINLDVQGGAATVGIWIDWGGDGTFDPATDFFSFAGLPAGARVVQIMVPNNSVYAVGRSVNVRVRAFDPVNLPGGSLDASDFVGLATNGEVEDYRWNFGPTAVTLNSLSARAEAGDLAMLPIFIVMGIAAALIIVWAKRHRLA